MTSKPNRQLNSREMEIIRLIYCGLKNREIADVIGTTTHMVKNHLRKVYDKLGLWNRVEIALWETKRRFDRGELCQDQDVYTESRKGKG